MLGSIFEWALGIEDCSVQIEGDAVTLSRSNVTEADVQFEEKLGEPT
jgi:hypothetical protein